MNLKQLLIIRNGFVAFLAEPQGGNPEFVQPATQQPATQTITDGWHSGPHEAHYGTA